MTLSGLQGCEQGYEQAVLSQLLTELGAWQLTLLVWAAFLTSMIHGATGIAGGFLLAAVAAPVLGMHALVPVLSITLLISHGSRALLNLQDFSIKAYANVVIPAIPCIVLAALAYGKLSGAAIAFLLGTVVLLSIPLRRWSKNRQLKTSPATLRGAGAIYGLVSGAAIGPGMLLMPLLLGLGLNRKEFVATLAAIALTTNIVRSSVYGAADLLSAPTLLLGFFLGLATIPGTWIGRSILRRITDEKHAIAVEWLVVLGGLNFYWLGIRMLGG